MSLFKVQTAEWIINLDYTLLIVGLIQLLHPLMYLDFNDQLIGFSQSFMKANKSHHQPTLL